jgi:hypothetical protein
MTNDTASRLNSGGYFDGRPRRFLASMDMDNSYSKCPSNRGMPTSCVGVVRGHRRVLG